MPPPSCLRLLLVAILFGLLASSAPADVNVRFHTIGISGNYSNIAYKRGGGYIPLGVASWQISPDEYTYSGKAQMELFRQTQVDGKPTLVRIGAVTFPDGASGPYEALLMGQPDGSMSGSAVSVKSADFPAQSVRVINITAYTLNFLCGTTAFTLKPGASNMLKINGDGFGLSARLPRDGDFVEVGNGLYPMSAGYRTTIFALVSNWAQIQKDPKTDPTVQLMLLTDKP